ncbi:glypican-1-like [Clarias magur]|uniref:Glypican-1 n=1 Tax=Clarias magur TaxID=1594786 RepID=A0A8J4WSK1_CLAMG|nr:glypican-1-like [Clarias magur]
MGKKKPCIPCHHLTHSSITLSIYSPSLARWGEHLRVCPQGYTCCTSQIEENLSNLSKKEFEDQVKGSGHALQFSLNSQYKNFDGYFQELLNRSEVSLHDSLQSSIGSLYSQNARVFQDLYSDLRNYYRGSKLNLEEALNDFWGKLLERLVRGLNVRYSMGEDYLECVSKQAETLRPFGETVREFKLKVTRNFVAARSFVQGLVVAGEVVRKVSQVPLSTECVRALMKQTYCPNCREMAWAKPCAPYCRNVMKGCLANQADLDTEWKNLAEAMLQVADRLSRPYSVDAALRSLPKHIADAILHMQDNLNAFNSKVFQACGTPPENPSPEEPKKRGKPLAEDVSSTSAADVEKLLSDISRKIRSMMQYWINLPNKLCVDREAKRGDENKCWNGMAIDRYLPDVMGDGLANQINNPEVEIDITKPDMTIRQQIMQLKIMTSRIKNAINGNDVEFQDASDDVSGSGSGMCNDDQCFHNQQSMVHSTGRPKVYPNPPVKKTVVKGNGRRLLPCYALYLLSLATALLRR